MSKVRSIGRRAASRRRSNPERYGRRRVAAHSSFTSSRRTGRGSWAWTAAEARQSMVESLLTSSGSANADLAQDLITLRERSRALSRNNALVAGALQTMVQGVIGSGLTMQSRIDYRSLGLTREAAAAWQREAERLWSIWSHSTFCDAAGRCNFAGLQALAFRSQLDNGDVFVLRRACERPGWPWRLALQLLEADRVGNPLGRREGQRLDESSGYLTNGIEIGAMGEALRYWVSDRHPGDLFVGAPQWNPIPARGAQSGEWLVLQLGRPDRVDQARGIPMVAPVLEIMHILSQYTHAALTREQVSALFTAFIKTPGGTGLAPEETDDEDTNRPSDYRMGPGALLDLAEGEDVVLADPKSVGGAFDAFMTAVLRQVGPAFGIPVEVLTMHYQSSYSAARGAQLQFDQTRETRRSAFASQACDPVYGAFLAETIAGGTLQAPGFFDDPMVRAAYTRAEWTGPKPMQIDPEKEVRAARERITLTLSNRQEETAALTGGDWEANVEQLGIEAKLIKELGLDVEPVAERIRTEPQAQAQAPAPAEEQDLAERSEGEDEA